MLFGHVRNCLAVTIDGIRAAPRQCIGGLCPMVVSRTGFLLTPLVVTLALARTWYRAGLPLPHLPRRAAVLPRA
ncbi:hypothetical protein [Acidocella aquatica]|uniref:hypothetical protein n=1 Tax=Acidocella aquatica TaxID=1922313 RepID=UPI0024E064D3|nr:hypothetical protein [Acidocella aquatica]